MSARISSSIGGGMPAEAWWQARGFEWAIAERPDRVEIVSASAAAPEVLSYSSGVAFGRSGELRWRRTRRGLHLVLIDDRGEILPGAEGGSVATCEAAGDTEVFLWGERGDDELFWETRIPRPLRYPLAVGRFAAATVRSYRFETAEFVPVAGGFGQERRVKEISRLVDLHGVDR